MRFSGLDYVIIAGAVMLATLGYVLAMPSREQQREKLSNGPRFWFGIGLSAALFSEAVRFLLMSAWWSLVDFAENVL